MSLSRFPIRCAVTAAGLVVALAAPTVRAQSWRVHGTGAGAHAVSGHQKDELSFGASALGAVEYAFLPELGAALELGWVFLSQGDPPKNPDLERIAAERPAQEQHLGSLDEAEHHQALYGGIGGLDRFDTSTITGHEIRECQRWTPRQARK